MNTQLWGVDLGGTKIEGVVLKSAINPEVLVRHRIPTEGEQGYEHILGRIKFLIDYLIKETGSNPDHIGFATPGAFDPKLGAMKNCNSISLNGKDLYSDLENLLGCKVNIANDANCFALAETRMGIVKEKYPNSQVVFGVILGTGTGGGIVVNNQVINGLQGIGGEWGHNFLDTSGGTCYCGRIGCVETMISGSGLERYYQSITGNELSLKKIYENLKIGGDEAASKTINRLIDNFGKALSVVINILDPDVVVVGGGVGNIDELYSKNIFKNYVFNTEVHTPIVKPKLGDSAGVFGAAFLSAGS